MPKAAYRSDFRENTSFCSQRDSNLGPLAQQASVLPLDYCDLHRCQSRCVDASELTRQMTKFFMDFRDHSSVVIMDKMIVLFFTIADSTCEQLKLRSAFFCSLCIRTIT